MRYLTAMALTGLIAVTGLAAVTTEEAAAAYKAGPFAFLSEDYFARFSYDPSATPAAGEMAIGPDWSIIVDTDADPLTSLMAGHLAEFFAQRTGISLPVFSATEGDVAVKKAIVVEDKDGGDPSSPGSYTITVAVDRVVVRGSDPSGARDGIVHLVDRMGFRAAPILEIGKVASTPRLGLRVGAVPWMGSYRDAAFLGNNAVIVTDGVDTRNKANTLLHALSTSTAIPELVGLQDPALLKRLAENAREARRYGLKTFIPLRMWDFYPADAPIFMNHPGLRGAEVLFFTNQPPAGHLLCTEDPLMRRYLMESVRGLFEAVPLDGVLIIIGGEGFQHCYMRPAAVEKGHTNCDRCDELGAETVVANLCNYMGEAAREANPDGLVVAWPYSANHFWSADDDQAAFISKLGPGTAFLTEIEKDETLSKPDGVAKLIWDYSIDLIGPTDRARRQIAACKARGVPVFLKSEPELAFEAPGLPYISCVDRWFDRANALATSGADGAWVFPWFQACYGTTSTEVYKFAWWNPAPNRETALAKLADRIAGPEAAVHLRETWAHVSEAVSWSPEQPPYFRGPYYLGPAHPMCADPDAELPDVFQAGGRFGSHVLTVERGDVEVFGQYYRKMEQALRQAVESLDAAAPLVPERCRLTFQAEVLPTRWFYGIARTHANFYESCRLRDFFTGFAAQESSTPEELADAQSEFERWRAVLADERENTMAAIPIVEQDPRLDVRNGMGTALAPAADMMRAKLDLLGHEMNVFLPRLAQRCGLNEQATVAPNPE